MQLHKQYPVSLTESRKAQEHVYKHMVPTQLTRYSLLSDLLDADLFVKHENHNPTGSFKVRGGINLMHHLQQSDVAGVVTFSTGVTLVEAGQTFEEAAQVVESIVVEKGYYYVHPANEPHLVNGVGTEFLEILDTIPDIDAIIVPIGAGSEAAAAVTVLHSINTEIEIYAVQAANSSAAYESWKKGAITTAPNTTFAGGFATGTGYELPFSIYRESLTDFILLSEEEIYEGIALAAYYTQNLLEGAGASTIMAALKLQKRLQGKKVVLQFSGCNASPDEIRKSYAHPFFANGCDHP